MSMGAAPRPLGAHFIDRLDYLGHFYDRKRGGRTPPKEFLANVDLGAGLSPQLATAIEEGRTSTGGSSRILRSDSLDCTENPKYLLLRSKNEGLPTF